MPICPECGFEYHPSTGACPDCGADLVDHLPDEGASQWRESGEAEQVVLCTVSGEIHARLLEAVLVSQGIRVRLQAGWPFDGLANVLKPPPPFGSPLNTPTRVYVNRPDLPRARQIYEDFECTGAQAVEWNDPPDDRAEAD